jgi:rubredoxin
MSRAPSLWCEARCEYLYDPSPVGCQQTAPGAFGFAEATKAARRAGWTVLAGKWCCPVCRKRKEDPTRSP